MLFTKNKILTKISEFTCSLYATPVYSENLALFSYMIGLIQALVLKLNEYDEYFICLLLEYNSFVELLNL